MNDRKKTGVYYCNCCYTTCSKTNFLISNDIASSSGERDVTENKSQAELKRYYCLLKKVFHLSTYGRTSLQFYSFSPLDT